MQIKRLDHVNIRTQKMQTMIQWYEQVLGLKQGYRPAGGSGAWLYAGDQPFVHLVAVGSNPGAGSEQPLKLEHFSFRATGLAIFEQRLKDLGQAYKKSQIEEIGLVLFNIWDPDGNHIHVDFPSAEQVSS